MNRQTAMPLNRNRMLAGVISYVASAFALHGAVAQTPALGAYNAPITETSVSGISSGAYMAVQFATAWSAVVKGVGAIAGGPYGCSGGFGSTALSTCMMGQPVAAIADLARLPDTLAAQGRIDPVEGIARQKIYLFSGYNDAVVYRPVTDWLNVLYRKRLGGNAGNLFYQTTIGAGHAQVTSDYGSACPANGGRYINNCGYDQAGVILQHIYGALNPPNRATLHGALMRFAQSAYTAPAGPADDSLGKTGFVYVPADCAAGAACRVHVALHGCKQSFDTIREVFVRHAGYNAWADSNHIIVLYPQTTPSYGIAPFAGVTNPEGCWDWWGYLDPNPSADPRFLTKDGPQIAALKRMVEHLTAGAVPAATTIPPSPSAGPMLVVNDVSDTAVALAWTSVAGAERYEVWRGRADGGDMASVAVISGLSFADSGLPPKTAYRYRVRPILADGPGPLSDPVSALTRATPPRCDEPGTCRVVR